MNERIKELAERCGFRSNPDIYDRNQSFDIALFAELIVKECIRVPYDMWDKADLNADTAVKIEHRIKEHFGVEE